eukprot:jgi/Undpi1/5477/HiC_scaffold_2.g00756.m1
MAITSDDSVVTGSAKKDEEEHDKIWPGRKIGSGGDGKEDKDEGYEIAWEDREGTARNPMDEDGEKEKEERRGEDEEGGGGDEEEGEEEEMEEEEGVEEMDQEQEGEEEAGDGEGCDNYGEEDDAMSNGSPDAGSSDCDAFGGHMSRSSRKTNKSVWSQLRKACDRCTSKKVKCDGKKGCFQCSRVGATCHFSICRRSGPRAPYVAEYDSKAQVISWNANFSGVGGGAASRTMDKLMAHRQELHRELPQQLPPLPPRLEPNDVAPPALLVVQRNPEFHFEN